MNFANWNCDEFVNSFRRTPPMMNQIQLEYVQQQLPPRVLSLLVW
jgi:hypothetical protein